MSIHAFKWAAIALAASMSLSVYADTQSPLTGNTSDPSNWRFAPGQNIGGVAGLLDGVAMLSFQTKQGQWMACSGSLLAGGQYVLTAAHCADNFTSMYVDFGWHNGASKVSRTVSTANAFVHHGWNGTLDTGADVAILKLDHAVTGIQGYKLSTTNDLGKTHIMAGYGTTQNAHVDADTDWGDWRYGHYAFNTFDVDSGTFNKAIKDVIPAWDNSTTDKYGMTYMVDFDSGDQANNSLQILADATGNKWTSGAGLAGMEGLIAGGDSGGGDFVWNGSEWVLSGVHSWGWQVCGYFGLTCDNAPNNGSSFGDVSGSTAVFSHLAWINAITNPVPEPSTYALMLGGIGLLGWRARRRQK